MLNANAALIVSTPIHEKEIAKMTSFLGDMGLVRADSIPHTEEGDKTFLRLGLFVLSRQRSNGWHWVDWVASTKKRWGEELFSGVMDLYGEYDLYYLQDLINLHYDFPLHARKWKLSPSHYRLVRTLPQSSQIRLLTDAENKRWGASKTLRVEVQKEREAIKALQSNADGSNSSDSDNTHPDPSEETNTHTPAKVSVEFEASVERVRNVLSYHAKKAEELPMGQYRVKIEIEKLEDEVIEGKR